MEYGGAEWDGWKLLPQPAEGEWVSHYHIYVDESGKCQMPQTEFTCLCGFVGHINEWQRVSADWTACRFKWQIPAVHMARIMNPEKKEDFWAQRKKELGDRWEEWRDALLEDFAGIIGRSAVICVGIVIDAEGYRKALSSPETTLHQKDSNVFSFHHIIMRGLERVSMVDRHSPVSIVVDDDPQNVKSYYDLLDGLRSIPDSRFEHLKKRIKAISFCDDEYFPGLQAADMVAYETRHLARKLKVDSSAVPSELLYHLTHAGLHGPQFFSADGLLELGKNIKKALDEGKYDGKREL